MMKKAVVDVIDLCGDDDSSASQEPLPRKNMFLKSPLTSSIKSSSVKNFGRKQRRYKHNAEKLEREKCIISLLSSSDEEEIFKLSPRSSVLVGEVAGKCKRMSRSPPCPTARSSNNLDNYGCGSEHEIDSLELTSTGPFIALSSPSFKTMSVKNICVDMIDELNIAASELNNPRVPAMTVLGAVHNFQNAANPLGISNGSTTDDDLIPTPSIQVLNRIGGKLYPDLRHTFVRALIKHAIKARTAAALRPVFDAAVRAVIVLSVVCDHPIRTSYACQRIKGIGKELFGVLQEAETEPYYYNPTPSKFSAVAPAVLVALLSYEQGQNQYHPDRGSSETCPIEDLFSLVNELLDPAEVFLNRPIDVYLDKNNLDPHWAQVKKLCNDNAPAGCCSFIKERRNRKKSPRYGIVYELTEKGRQVAERLRKELSSATNAPLGPLRQLPSAFVNKKYKSVTMCVDHREGGGGSRSLHKLCNYLDEGNVPYVVRELKIADYMFFVHDKIAPVLIERKSAEDVAGSLADGRWERQQRNMRKALYVLGGGEARRGHICYLIEGDASRRTVHGGNVGRRSWDQSVKDVEDAIATLPKLGFSVLRSTSCMGSMNELAKVASEVSWQYYNGSLDCKYTYDEFIRLLKECDETKGDPPTSAEHQNPTPIVLDDYTAKLSSAREKKGTEGKSAADYAVNGERITELNKLSLTQLKTLCRERFEKTTGNKAKLVALLSRPRKPEVLITRMRHGQYVPKMPSCNAALLVALVVHWREGSEGLTKETLMVYAQETGIQDMSRAPGSLYDGFSGMRELTSGDPPLVNDSKKRYSLTVRPVGYAGIDIARALHVVAHSEGLCRCGRLDF